MIKKQFKLTNEIPVKRFYMDVKFEVECPCCKSNVERDFNSDYISYPTPGRKEDWYFYCDACDCEFEVPVQIDMDVTVTFEPEKTRKI